MIDAIKNGAHKALAFVSQHRLLFGVGAIGAGLGYLFVSSTAQAAPASLPTAKNATPLPGGGIKQGNVVVPPPAAVQTGNAMFVTTQDPAPAGNLIARSGPGQMYPSVGYYPKDGPVSVLSGPEGGFLHVQGPGIKDGQAVVLEGWASADYLKPADSNPLAAAQGVLHDLGLA